MESVQVRDTDVKENDVLLAFLRLRTASNPARRLRDYIELRVRSEEITEVVPYQLVIIKQQYPYCRHPGPCDAIFAGRHVKRALQHC
jgi:hypothetical protein